MRACPVWSSPLRLGGRGGRIKLQMGTGLSRAVPKLVSCVTGRESTVSETVQDLAILFALALYLNRLGRPSALGRLWRSAIIPPSASADCVIARPRAGFPFASLPTPSFAHALVPPNMLCYRDIRLIGAAARGLRHHALDRHQSNRNRATAGFRRDRSRSAVHESANASPVKRSSLMTASSPMWWTKTI